MSTSKNYIRPESIEGLKAKGIKAMTLKQAKDSNISIGGGGSPWVHEFPSNVAPINLGKEWVANKTVDIVDALVAENRDGSGHHIRCYAADNSVVLGTNEIQQILLDGFEAKVMIRNQSESEFESNKSSLQSELDALEAVEIAQRDDDKIKSLQRSIKRSYDMFRGLGTVHSVIKGEQLNDDEADWETNEDDAAEVAMNEA